MAIMVNGEGHVLMLCHAVGPFAGRWSMPFIGVADNETAEDALDRLLREAFHVVPGPQEFLDTFYLTGSGGERFVVNAFTCIQWQGEPRYARGIYDDAVWAPPGRPGSLDLIPEVREWLLASYEAEVDTWGTEYDPQQLRQVLVDARGELIAAFEELPYHLRAEVLEEGWTPLDVLVHAVDVEAYYVAETRRGSEQPGHTWRPFNDAQWFDLLQLRPLEDEVTVRERMDTVREVTLEWLEGITARALAGYVNHPERGVVQIGDGIEKVASHDREHVNQLRRMAQAAAIAQASDPGSALGREN